MSELQNIKLTKRTYNFSNIPDTLNEEFSEFIIEPPNINDIFNIYNKMFYDIPKTGKFSHKDILIKSIKYAGLPINPKKEELKELKEQLDDLKEDLDSIEEEHDFFKNGSVIQVRNNEQLNYYMQSGRKRKINSTAAFQIIKKRAGKKEISNKDFSIPLDSQAIAGIRVGPPINNAEDLNIDILTINRFDDRSIDD